MISEERKAEGRRRKQDLTASFAKDNNFSPGLFPSGMLPPRQPEKPELVSVPHRREKQNSRKEKARELITRAAQESGRDNERFCEFLNRDRVPIDPRWRVNSWLEAWGNLKLRPRIRAFKSRYRSAA